MKVSHNFHRRKTDTTIRPPKRSEKMKCSCIRPATLTEHHKNAVCVVPTVRNSWIDEVSHRRGSHCSIFMITCQGQAAAPCLCLPLAQNLWIDTTPSAWPLWLLRNRCGETCERQRSCKLCMAFLRLVSCQKIGIPARQQAGAGDRSS